MATNRLAQALDDARAAERPILDLTLSNPTLADFEYPADLLAPLADARALVYSPQPAGLLDAREAIVADYARRDIAISPDRIVLTASTSEAYSLLFKILCDAGDEVLTPRPSYPLFEHLTALETVVARPYDLEYHRSWSIDIDGLERAWCPRTRAALAVSPNNPTGTFLKRAELDRLARMCIDHDAALIVDEVFADYELTAGASAAYARPLERQDVLVFSLGGLSKSIGLPQVKLGWIAIAGPSAKVRDAVTRLELACDTYLSVSTPVQVAARGLLEQGATVREQIQRRVRANYRYLSTEISRTPACRLLESEGGWYAVIQVPSLGSEEELVLNLLRSEDVLVHPGYFFDFARESFLVVSLLVPESTFADGVSRILRHSDCRQFA